MHPNPLYREDNRARMRDLVDDIGLGMIFRTTPEGPRVAHTPLVWHGEDRLRFHLARGNALAGHLDANTALVTVTGPQGYVSPRWYEDRNSVPTWDYAAVEMEGPVRRLPDAELEALLHALIERHESRLGGDPWLASEVQEGKWLQLFKGILGFEIEVRAWRSTFKLSQKRSPEEREIIAGGLERAGNSSLAAGIRGGEG